MVMSRKLAERQRYQHAPFQRYTRQGHTVTFFAPCPLNPTRLLRIGCFRCCYLPLTMKRMLCLFFTMIVLVILLITSQKLTVIQQTAEDYAIRLNPVVRETSNSNSHSPVRPENRPSAAEKNKDVEQKIPANSNKTKLSQATLKRDAKAEMKATSHSEFAPQSKQAQNAVSAALGDKGEVANDGEPGKVIKAKPSRSQPPLRNHKQVHGPHVLSDPKKLHEKQEAMRKDGELRALLEQDKDYMDPDEIENTNSEIRHVFFLKVHKAASTTVMNVLYRFAIKRHLKVMLPRRSNILSENSKYWKRNVMPLPKHTSHFDILCNHLIFNEQSIRSGLGRNAKFIGIVREPFQQFVSAFHYYRKTFNIRYLVKIPGEDPVDTYLQNPRKHETKFLSYTHNRMSFDFGMNPHWMTNEQAIRSYINYLNKTFLLVMVSERFDESMVLMKRLLGWRLQDILYIKNNVFKKPDTGHHYTEEQKSAHSDFNRADYALYEHFSRLFQTKVENEGKLFAEEVATFVALREKVEKFCHGSEEEKMLSLAATAWTPVFEVKRLDCRLMTLPEMPFVNVMKRRQYSASALMQMDRMERMLKMERFHAARTWRFRRN